MNIFHRQTLEMAGKTPAPDAGRKRIAQMEREFLFQLVGTERVKRAVSHRFTGESLHVHLFESARDLLCTPTATTRLPKAN